MIVITDKGTFGPFQNVTPFPFENYLDCDGVKYFFSVIGSNYSIEDSPMPVIAPTVAIPEKVKMRQARYALLYAGMLDTVQSFIDGMPDGEPGSETRLAKDAAQIEWHTSEFVRRDNPLVAAAQVVLGLTDGQIDDLFVYAETIP